MVKKAGDKTGQFGLWLMEYIQENYPDRGYQVFYDHGDPSHYSGVAVIKGFLGDQVAKDNKLAEVDVMVVNEDHDILLLIEIEESPLSPKTLLGDVFASLFSTKFAVNINGRNTNFLVSKQTRFLVAGYVPAKTIKKINLMADTRSRLEEFPTPPDSIAIDKVVFVIEEELDSCLVSLQNKVMDYLEIK